MLLSLFAFVLSEGDSAAGHCLAVTRPTPPLVMPVWALGGDGQDTDPGAIPDQHLFAVILDNTQDSNRKLASNCPGVSRSSTCQPYKYIDPLYNPCNAPVTSAGISMPTAAAKPDSSTTILAQDTG